MSVTDAQFRELLRGKSGGQMVLLAEIEFAYQTAVGPGTGTIYLSDGKYRTKEGEAPSLTRYRDVIKKAPTFSRAIDVKKLGGRWTMSQGSLTLENVDGSMDFMLDAIIDGREIRFYAGRGGDNPWPRADFRQVNVVTVYQVKAANDEIVVSMRDKNYRLDDGIVGDPLGTGPNPDKPKPILFGCIKNFDFTPWVIDSANLVYKLNDFAMDTSIWTTDLIDVRDGGLSLRTAVLFIFTSATMTANAGTDTLTRTTPHNLAVDDVILFRQGVPGALFAGLAQDIQYWVIAAGLTANDYRLSLTRGGAAVDITGTVMTGTWTVERRRFYIDAAASTITLSQLPTYRATIDFNVVDAALELGPNQVPHKAFKYLLAHYSKLVASEYDATAIDAIATTDYGNIRCSIAILDRMKLLPIIDAIAASTYTWYGWTSAGVLTVGRLDLASLSSATAIATITSAEIAEGTDISVENLPLPWGKVTLDSDPNADVQGGSFSPLLTAANRSIWDRPYQVRVTTTDPAGTDYLGNWWDYHKSAIDSDPIPTAIGTPLMSGVYVGSPAQDVCDAITQLFKPWTRVYSETVGIEFYGLNPGDCVELVHPRYGLEDGKNVRVVSVTPRFSDGLCDLTFVAQNDPDYLTASRA